jgi:flagellar biosynthetic protein FliO
MVSVLGVLALLAATLWWLRRRGFAAALPGRSNRPRLERVERVPLGPQHSLHLIRMGGQALLLVCSPAGCTVVATRDWREIDPEALP